MLSVLNQNNDKSVEVAPAQDGTRIIFSIPTFQLSFKFFWTKESSVFAEVLQTIANTIINQAYKLTPEVFFEAKYNDETVQLYHPNHDTTHAIRQMIYGQRYLELTEIHGQKIWMDTLKECTPEEIACMLLAFYCLRIGRITEEGVHQHTLRSAQLFELLATQLGFIDLLVANIKAAMHDSKPTLADKHRYNGFAGTSEVQFRKALLVHKLVEIVHRVDLVRCWDSKGELKFQVIRDPLVKALTGLLGDEALAKRVAIEFMNYACRLCVETGNKVNLKELGFEHPKYDKGLKIQSTKRVDACIERLLSLRPPILEESTKELEVMARSPLHRPTIKKAKTTL